MSDYNMTTAYIDLDDGWHKSGFGGDIFGWERPTVYTHASTLADRYVFVQYWMFYPSDTSPLNIRGNATAADVKHEGDWEMFMNVIELDKENCKIWLRSCTASQHYVGQTLPTQARFSDRIPYDPFPMPGEVVVGMNGTHPEIYVAGGAHATFFQSSTFEIPTAPGEWTNCYNHPWWTWPWPDADTTENLKDLDGDNKPDPLVGTGRKSEPTSYSIVPLDYNTAQWAGHWGQMLDLWDGPPGPQWRRAWLFPGHNTSIAPSAPAACPSALLRATATARHVTPRYARQKALGLRLRATAPGLSSLLRWPTPGLLGTYTN